MSRSANRTSDIWVATETFACQIDGEQVIVHQGETRVRVGHPLLDRYEGYFEPVNSDVHFDIEEATAEPGRKRGAR